MAISGRFVLLVLLGVVPVLVLAGWGTVFLVAAVLLGIFGGMLADLLTANNVIGNYSLKVPMGGTVVNVFQLSNWTLFFVFSAILATVSLRFLNKVKEEGEVRRDRVMLRMMHAMKLSNVTRELATVKVFNIFGTKDKKRA